MTARSLSAICHCRSVHSVASELWLMLASSCARSAAFRACEWTFTVTIQRGSAVSLGQRIWIAARPFIFFVLATDVLKCCDPWSEPDSMYSRSQTVGCHMQKSVAWPPRWRVSHVAIDFPDTCTCILVFPHWEISLVMYRPIYSNRKQAKTIKRKQYQKSENVDRSIGLP